MHRLLTASFPGLAALALAASAGASPQSSAEAPRVASPAPLDGGDPRLDTRPDHATVGGPVTYAPRLEFSGALPDAEVRAPQQPLTIDRERLHFDVLDDAHWVRGRTYKSKVAGDGFTYIPFLGSDAPKSYPVHFELAAAHVGSLQLDVKGARAVSRRGDRLAIERGAVEVRYDFELDSVEQSFALDLGLDLAGQASDLELVLDVTTDLEARGDGLGFKFSNELGGVGYGEAIVFDGAGRRAPVESRLVGGRLTLTVSADFLESATGKIVVDPLFRTFGVDDVSGAQSNVDVAYDVVSDTFLYVYEDEFSGSDTDVYVTHVSSAGVILNGRYVESGSDRWRDPAIATVPAAQRALVVAARSDGTATSVAGRLISTASGNPYGGAIDISSVNPFVRQWNPDVGGTVAADGDRFMVVWSAAFPSQQDITARAVGIDGTPGAVYFIDSVPTRTSFSPAISRSTGDPATVNRWTIAYTNSELGTSSSSLWVAQIDGTGALTLGATEVLRRGSAGENFGRAQVSDAKVVDDVSTPVFAVTYERFAGPRVDTFVTFCTGRRVLSSFELQRSEHSNVSVHQLLPRIDTTRDDFVVTYLEQAGSRWDAYITSFELTEGRFLAVSERRVPLGRTGSIEAPIGYVPRGGATIASRRSGGYLTSQIVGIGLDRGVDTGLNVDGATYFAPSDTSPASQYCYGNPNSTGQRGFIRLSGNRSATSTKTMRASGLPSNRIGFFVVGDGYANSQPGDSAGVLCVGGTVGNFIGQIMSTGSAGTLTATFDPASIPHGGNFVTAMPGQSWQITAWHNDYIGGVRTSNYTNAVTLYLD